MDRIIKVLSEIRPEFDFTTSNDFINDGMLDSFDIISLVSTLEDTFGINIDGTEIIPENFSNLASITKLIMKHGGKI